MPQPTHFCEDCGSPLEEGASFCETCGAPVNRTAEIPPAAPAASRPQPPASPPPAPPIQRRPQAPVSLPTAQVPPWPAAARYQQPSQPPPPSPMGYYQPVQPFPPPPPPMGYYQPPPPPRRKTPTWLIIGGVVLGLLVCCGVAVVLVSLVGGLSFLSQAPGLAENLPGAPGSVGEETPMAADTGVTPITPGDIILTPVAPDDTEPPVDVDEPTLTSEPAPNEPKPTPALPAPKGQRLAFTDDLSTNDNGWTSFGGDTPPSHGYLISTYFILTSKENGEVLAWIPKIDNDQYKVKDFEIEFYGIQWNGDGYYGLDFHYADDQNYYQVAVKEGKFIIRKKINGQFTNLTQGGWVPSNSIYPSGPSKIKVICHGDVIRLEINDDLMAQLKDGSLPEGDVALTAGVLPEALDGTTFEARFNGFDVVWWK